MRVRELDGMDRDIECHLDKGEEVMGKMDSYLKWRRDEMDRNNRNDTRHHVSCSSAIILVTSLFMSVLESRHSHLKKNKERIPSSSSPSSSSSLVSSSSEEASKWKCITERQTFHTFCQIMHGRLEPCISVLTHVNERGGSDWISLIWGCFLSKRTFALSLLYVHFKWIHSWEGMLNELTSQRKRSEGQTGKLTSTGMKMKWSFHVLHSASCSSWYTEQEWTVQVQIRQLKRVNAFKV